MAMNKKKSALGSTPLSQGIFTPTTNIDRNTDKLKNQETDIQDSRIKIKESLFQDNREQKEETNLPSSQSEENTNQESNIQDSRIKTQESSFLQETAKEKVNFRLPMELNDWLDELVKQGKRNHGSKIPKELWVQASLEVFRMIPINWGDIQSVDELREKFKNLDSLFKNLE